MKSMSKSEILGLHYCTLYVWATSINALPVTKVALKKALKPNHRYTVDCTAKCPMTRKGKELEYCHYVILL